MGRPPTGGPPDVDTDLLFDTLVGTAFYGALVDGRNADQLADKLCSLMLRESAHDKTGATMTQQESDELSAAFRALLDEVAGIERKILGADPHSTSPMSSTGTG